MGKFRRRLRASDPAERGILRIGLIAIVAVMSAGALGYAYAGSLQANHALKQGIENAHLTTRAQQQTAEAQRVAADAAQKALAACVAYKNIAEAPVSVDPRTHHPSVLGLKLLGDFRYAYDKAGCQLGALSPADPRVVPYIPKDPSK